MNLQNATALFCTSLNCHAQLSCALKIFIAPCSGQFESSLSIYSTHRLMYFSRAEIVLLHGCQCSPLRRKFMVNSPALSLLMKHLVIGQRLKTPKNLSAFHWSPRGSAVSIGQHFVATRVVHLPKSIETSLIIDSDQSGPNHQLMQLCTARTAWSDSVLNAIRNASSPMFFCT